MCLQIIYLIYMYKEDLVYNSLQRLLCQKTQPIKPINHNCMQIICVKISYVSYYTHFRANTPKKGMKPLISPQQWGK